MVDENTAVAEGTSSRASSHGEGKPHCMLQPARERVFATPSGRAEFSVVPLPDDVDPGRRRLVLTTIRSHDQFNTTIYSDDDRYRGLKGLRTVVFMNEADMRDHSLDDFDLIADYSTQSEQPLTKHPVVETTSSHETAPR